MLDTISPTKHMNTTTTYDISISENGIWAGDGKFDWTIGDDSCSGCIRDCPAVLEEGAYEAIENAITETDNEMEGELEVCGKTYHWTLTES
jgi:hypothetical protein